MSAEGRDLRLREWSFMLLVVVVAGACIRLGFWQLARLEERREAIQRIQTRLESTPLLIDSSAIDTGNAYRRAIAEGEFDPQHQILLENQSLDGQPGFHLITPLMFQGEPGGILIDRGWIPFETGIEGELDAFEVPGTHAVAGILIPSVEQPTWNFLADPAPGPGDPPLQTWRFLTTDLVQRQIGYPLAPLILVQTEALDPGQALPRPDPRIDLDEGPHLGYAIQWFAFAAIAIIGGGLWIRRKLVQGKVTS